MLASTGVTYTCMSKIQYTIPNKLCIVYSCKHRYNTSKYYVLMSKTLLYWPFNIRICYIHYTYTCNSSFLMYSITIVVFFSHRMIYLYAPLYSGSDYIVNIQNASFRTFTVTFQPRQLNLTEHMISISDDDIFEDKEHFRLRIHALRFIGEAANVFRAAPQVTSSFAEIAIKDNDGEFSIPSFTICALVISHNVSCSNIG